MWLTKLTVVALFLIARMCRAKIVLATPNPNESTSTLDQDLINILTSCYRDQISAIGLAGNLSETLIKTLSTQHFIPVILFDTPADVTKKPSPARHVPVRFRRKLQVFVVEISFWKQLYCVIEENIRSSIWWNHMASFFILDRSPKCRKATDYFRTAWHFNMLNAKVMCYGNDGRTIIISYNPLTGVAPASWKRVNVFPGAYNHPATMFSREYTGNESMCVDLDYEKSKDAGGFRFRVHGNPPEDFIYNKEHLNANQFLSTQDRVFYTIYHTMNATPIFTNDSSIDIVKKPHAMRFTWDDSVMTYPHWQTGLVLISQFRGHKSQVNKIISVIDIYSRCGLAIVYLITLVFFKFFAGQALMPALLNLIRITCGTGFSNLPVNTASRIYLTSILFFALTFLGIYQSGLAALLTTKIPLQNIDTVKDVVKFDYNVFGSSESKYMIDLPDVERRYMKIDDVRDCILRVQHDPSAVCLWYPEASALDGARMCKLHVSSHVIVPLHVGFKIRWEWSLEERVNIILAKMVEADVLQPWFIKCNPTDLRDFEFDEEVMKNTTHKVLEIGELLFAFILLLIGLACATIVFILELIVHQYEIKIISTVRVQPLN